MRTDRSEQVAETSVNQLVNPGKDWELTVGLLPAAAASQRIPSFDTLVTEIELYDFLSKSPDIGNFRTRVNGLLHPLGFTQWSHCMVDATIDVLDPFGNYPKGFVEQYAREEFYRDDLVSRHMMVSEKPLFEHQVYAFLSSAPLEYGVISRNLELHKLMREYGMGNTISIPIVEQDTRAVFSVTTKSGDTVGFESCVLGNFNSLLMLAKAVNNIGCRKFSRKFHSPLTNTVIPIASKPLQLLTVLGTKDLTLIEAAAVLNISIYTANQQIAAAKRAFRANTTHGAIVAAIQSGHINLDV